MTLEQELSNVRSYLQIQQLMHDGDFDVEIDVAAEILQYESLNLILQPLVENAIDHGIDLKTEGRGRITIRGWQEPAQSRSHTGQIWNLTHNPKRNPVQNPVENQMWNPAQIIW